VHPRGSHQQRANRLRFAVRLEIRPREKILNFDTTAIRRLRDALLASDAEPVAADPAARTNEPGAAVLSRVEPFAETMYLVMIADGDPAPAEQDALAATFEILTDARVGRAVIDELIEQFRANVARYGIEARLEQIGARLGADRDDREIAWTLAAAMALADDQIDASENKVVAWAQEYFGITDRRARTLADS
jgi:uncharacterized tellurite resistance protein B-like protein